MKKLQTIILLLISTITFSQDFEGIIEYKITYENLNEQNKVDIKGLENFLGTKSIFTTKKGAYKQISEGQYMSFQVYKPNDAKLYYKDLK